MRAWRYAALGAALGLGAPLGLLALRRLANGRDRGWWRREIFGNGLTYGYLTGSTCAVFAAFGCTVGHRADQLIASHGEIDRLREEFTSVIAHDLRSPVSALHLQSQLLLRQGREGEVHVPRRAIERFGRATSDLARMIDDLLDASRLESRRLNMTPQVMHLEHLASEIVERQRPALGRHPIEVTAVPAPPVFVDPQRFAQILINLLDNAAKYSDEDRPIRVWVEPADGGVVVRVHDEGWGIAPDELPHLFDRFYRAKRARAKKAGLGLGLPIVKGLVEAQHGRITVVSTPNRGSTFTVWFPEDVSSR